MTHLAKASVSDDVKALFFLYIYVNLWSGLQGLHESRLLVMHFDSQANSNDTVTLQRIGERKYENMRSEHSMH